MVDNLKKLVSDLKDILTNEMDLYRDMVDLANKKRDVITKGDIKELDNITHIEQEIIINIGKLEDTRTEIVDMIMEELGLTNDDINVSKVLERLDQKDKVHLEKMRDDFIQILNELKEKNDLNNALIKDSLEYINFNLNLMTNASSENTYSDKVNNQKGKQNKNLFDAKA